MRVLVTLQPGLGHLHPIAPLAHALLAAGHDVRVGCSASFIPTVEATGLPAVSIGRDWLLTAPPHVALAHAPQPPPGSADGSVWITACGPEMARDILALARAWRPDVIVHDPAEHGASVAADVLTIPHATVQVGAYVSDYQNRLGWVPLLDDLRAAFGLPPDPAGEMPFRYLHLAFMPPSYHDSARPLPPTARFFRHETFDRSGDEAAPQWLEALPARPTVYATLGTVTNRETGVFEQILGAVDGEPINVVLTVGRGADPAALGAIPSNTRVERYVPQSALLPFCDAVLCHAGYGTVMGALSHGLPLVLLPRGADQPVHASRCEALGVGRVLRPADVSVTAIREALRDVLAEPAYRDAASRIRRELHELPDISGAVALIEHLVVTGDPVPGQRPAIVR
jgi:UDP:flavonoid glycosyltransferase YjiC (YdhE family)